MITWANNTICIKKFASNGNFIILEYTNNFGKLYRVIQKDKGIDYKERYAGTLKHCVDWANKHGASFVMVGCYDRNANIVSDCIKEGDPI